MFNNPLDPEHPLTPSEVVFLNGEQFAKKVMMGNIDLLHSGEKVSLTQLGQAVVTTAFLAAEAAGAVRLEARERKAMLGLRKVKELFAVPSSGSVPLPENSLEAVFAGLAARLAGKNDNDVRSIVYTWLRSDTTVPWSSAMDLFKAGMAERSVLEASEERKLKIFTVTHYSLPERTARLMKGQPAQSVQALLNNCERTRPEVWKLLEQGIKKAISDRTESSDTDFD